MHSVIFVNYFGVAIIRKYLSPCFSSLTHLHFSLVFLRSFFTLVFCRSFFTLVFCRSFFTLVFCKSFFTFPNGLSYFSKAAYIASVRLISIPSLPHKFKNHSSLRTRFQHYFFLFAKQACSIIITNEGVCTECCFLLLISKVSPKEPVKLIERVKMAHSFKELGSNLFHFIILNLPLHGCQRIFLNPLLTRDK